MAERLRHQGAESLVGAPEEQQQRDGGRRKRKGNLPKLPSQPFTEGGA